MPTPTSMPASASATNRLEPARRRSRAGLGRPPDALVERREREEHLGARARGRLLQDVDVAHDERPTRDDRERRPGRVELDEAGACERNLPSAGWYGSVAVPSATSSRSHDAARELASEHLGDVRLHADRAAVAIVRGPVGALFEMADVTERAPVHAAHVRVERPAERHPAHLRQRRLARLDPVLDAHRSRIEHMFVSEQG